VCVDLTDRVHHEEQCHEDGHHVRVADEPALVVDVFLGFLAAPPTRTHAASLSCWPGGRSDLSRSPTRRGFAPDCTESRPSSTSSIWAHSRSESRRSLLEIGSHMRFAEAMPQR